MTPLGETYAEWRRFLDRVAPQESGCWEWTGPLCKTTGYGQPTFNKVTIGAHRLAYMLWVGPIPAGKHWHIDHLCRNRACVNPGHLELVTRRENILRGVGVTAVNARKTHCDSGHSDWGVYVSGERYCRECSRVIYRANRDRLQAEGLTVRGTPRKRRWLGRAA